VQLMGNAAGGTCERPRFVSLLLLALLLFLLFGGSRISAAGKGLGEAVRHVKRAAGEAADPPPPAMNESPPELPSKEPKLLPAKGESSASTKEGDE
jgi:Sec-independent protein translocase protein TatA